MKEIDRFGTVSPHRMLMALRLERIYRLAVATGHLARFIVFGSFVTSKPARFAKLKVVEKSEAFPAAIVAYCAHALDETTLRRFREGMLSAKDNPRGVQLMTLCQMTSFEPVPEDYDKVCKEIARAYPPPGKKKDDK